jgi:hypothetical protein
LGWVNGEEDDKQVSRSLVSGSWWYAKAQSKEDGIGHAGETVLIRERVTNSVGELAASRKVKRW